MENAGTGPAFSFGWDDYAHGGFIFAIHGGTEPPPDTPARTSMYGRSGPQPLPEGNS